MRLFSNIRSIVLDAIAFARNLCRSRSALAGASAIKCWRPTPNRSAC